MGETQPALTVVTVDTYEAISDVLPHFWPHYEKSGCDVVGIERANKATRWPNKDIPRFAVGIDYFRSWSSFVGDPLLVNRWLAIIELFLTHQHFAKYANLCAIEWDMIFVKPLPPIDPNTGLILNLAGHNMAGFKAKQFFHLPWFMDRKRAEQILSKGKALVKAGDIEHGAPDFFMGLVIDRLGIPYTKIHFYTKNRLNGPEWDEARRHIANGAYGIHGVRDKAGIDRLLTPAPTPVLA